MIVGGARSDRSRGAWLQSYRNVTHTQAAEMLTKQAPNLRFPSDIRRFGILFKQLQEQRHAADYDPNSTFAKSDVLDLIEKAERAIDLFERCPTKHRRALAVLVLLGKPRR